MICLAGCQRPGSPLATQEWKGDPSLPDAATVFAQRDAEDKAKAMQDTAGLQAGSGARTDLTKAQESKAMPMPGQANDHSNVALDKAKGG